MQNNPTVSITDLLFSFHDSWSSGLRSESLGFLLLHDFLKTKQLLSHSPETNLAVQAKVNKNQSRGTTQPLSCDGCPDPEPQGSERIPGDCSGKQ